MKIQVDGKAKNVAANSTIGALLSGMGISPQIAITKVNGTVMPETCKLKTGDKIEIIKVVFGG